MLADVNVGGRRCPLFSLSDLRNNRVTQVVETDFPANCRLDKINLERNVLTYIPNRAFWRCGFTLTEL